MSRQPDDASDERGARRRTDSLLGSAAVERPRPARPREAAPGAVRRAALVVALEAALLAAVALVLLWLTVTGDPDSVGRALAEVVYVGLGAGLLSAAAVGLWRVAGWARAPVVVLQVLLGLLGWSLTFHGSLPLIGVPVLVMVATVFWLLATPEARLAYFHR